MIISVQGLVSSIIILLIFNSIINFSSRFKKISFCIYLILLTAVTGSVYENVGLGGDYDNYRNIFTLIDPKKYTVEVGFHYLNLVLKQFTDNFYVVFLTFMFIVNFFMLRTIYEHSGQIELSIILYIIACGYTSSANIVRQYIAGAIYYYSIKFLLKRKYIWFIALGTLAFTFHSTVIIPISIIIIINLFNEKLNKNFEIYFICINGLIIIEPIIRKIGLGLIDKGYNESSFNYGSSILHYLVQLAFVFFYYINRDKLTTHKEKLFANLSIIGLGFLLLSKSMVLYARFASYFTLFNAILSINILIKIDKGKKKRLFYYFLGVGLYIYYSLLTVKTLNAYNGNYIVDFLNQLL